MAHFLLLGFEVTSEEIVRLDFESHPFDFVWQPRAATEGRPYSTFTMTLGIQPGPISVGPLNSY